MPIFATLEQRAFAQPDCVAKLRYLRTAGTRRRGRARQVRVALTALALLGANQLGRSRVVAPVSIARMSRSVEGRPSGGGTWVVEQTEQHTLYSNGLTVRRDHEAQSVPRRFHVYRRDTLQRSSETFTTPVGIVFHTTESQILPMEPARNGALLRSREDVLDHAHNGRLYNYLIDRFGQVSAIVPEGQTALHAGHSIWASGEQVWVDLNESFLGVSFEAESAEPFRPTTAQVHAGRLLTEVLRSRYAIPEANCVTHAQVSVNPDNMRIGYHTDWGSAFPFRELGLTGGYELPVAAVTIFGFTHDDIFLQAIGSRPWPGLVAADQELASQASRLGLVPQEFSTQLQQRYKTLRTHRHD